MAKIDKDRLLERCEGNASAGLIVEVKKKLDGPDYGTVPRIQVPGRLMSRHGDRPCPRCDITNLEGSTN